MTPNKYYAIDNGLRRANSPQATADLGHRLENAVFLSLRRRKKSISYAAEIHQWECDFVTDMEAIQVCADLNPRNQEREVRGAIHAAALPGRRQALILTLNQRDRIVLDGTTVESHSRLGMVGRCYSRGLRLDGDSVKSILDRVGAKPVKRSSMKPGARSVPLRQRQEIQAVCLGRDGASVVDLAEGLVVKVVVVPGFDHHCCWSRVWAEIAVESQCH